MNKPLVIASNMYNERHQLGEWWENVCELADGGILIVDSGSDDGTIEFFQEKEKVYPDFVKLIIDDIIVREGYGPARNHLREMTRQHFPAAHWMLYLDGDERIYDFHELDFLKEYLRDEFDVVALPRLDWHDKEMTQCENDLYIHSDYQARMTRLFSGVNYVRRLHEQIQGYSKIYAKITNPKINHFHRVAKDKRDFIGKLCAKLHMEDAEYGHTYPMHHKEQHYRDLLEKEGLK